MDTGSSVCWFVPSTHGWSAACTGFIPTTLAYSLGGSTLKMLQAGVSHACFLEAAGYCVMLNYRKMQPLALHGILG